MRAHVPAMARQPQPNMARQHGGANAAMVDNRPAAILQRQQIAIINQGLQARPMFQPVQGGVVQGVMESFGHSHRNPDLDPDSLEEDDDGIHLVPEEDMRPEDAPIYQGLRKRLHELHSAKLYMEGNYPELLVNFVQTHGPLMNGCATLKERFLQIAGGVKDASKDHKKRVKDLATRTSIADLSDTYTDALALLAHQAEDLADAITDFIKEDTGDDDLDLDTIHEEGTDIWRAKWHQAILGVNGVLENQWPYWRQKIIDWIDDKQEEGLAYMDPDMPVAIDYIGSLAKGYKGPPKQSIRFTPEKFDVDANLTSLPLAAWAIQEQEAIIDRGRIWSKVTGPLFNRVLKPMQDSIQQGLVNAGLIGLGMDPNEPFEAVIDTEGLEDFADEEGADAAADSVRLSERDLEMRNSLFTLRHTDPARMQRIGAALQQAGFVVDDGHGHSFLTEHNEAAQTYAFTNAELQQIEDIVESTV